MEAGSLTIEMRQQTIEQVYDTVPTTFPYRTDSTRKPMMIDLHVAPRYLARLLMIFKQEHACSTLWCPKD